ncbi:MAG: transcriptional regulator [Spirochaetales bacterium]
MTSPFIETQASDDFNKARTQAIVYRILNLLTPRNEEMLSLQEVKEVLRPRTESYRGLQTVPVSRIVGSEGRYRDFNRHFLPKREELRKRWMNVDKAHLQDVNLPAIQLYEIGGLYFVRDGNHRVSVARSQGVQDIDAEVISLKSEVKLDPDLTREKIEQAVIQYEKKRFYEETDFPRLVPDYELEFTETGRYDEIKHHILVHKYYINQGVEDEIPFETALLSWYHGVYEPIVSIIRSERLLRNFPGRTEADLYTWLVKHWHILKEQHGESYSMKDAALDFAYSHGRGIRNVFRRFIDRLRRRTNDPDSVLAEAHKRPADESGDKDLHYEITTPAGFATENRNLRLLSKVVLDRPGA